MLMDEVDDLQVLVDELDDSYRCGWMVAIGAGG